MAKKKAKATSESSIEHVKQLAKDAIKKGKRKVLTAALELAVEVLHKLGTGDKKAKKVSKKASGKSVKKAVKKVTKKAVDKAKKTVKKAVKKTKKASTKKKAAKQ